MAYIVLQNNCLHRIAKTEANLKNIIPNKQFYENKNWVREITDQQFEDLNLGKKELGVVTDTSITFEDPFVPLTSTRFAVSAEAINAEIQYKIDLLTKNLNNIKFNDNTTFQNEISSYKTVLENLNTSAWVYPMTKTLEQYIQDNSLGTPVSSLQLQ